MPAFEFSSMESPLNFTTTSFALGLGFAYTVNEGNDVVMGVNYQNMTLKNESAADTLGGVLPDTETSSTIMPGFYIGTQHEFTDWLELRAAASKRYDVSEWPEVRYSRLM